jgi:hypothetical protein
MSVSMYWSPSDRLKYRVSKSDSGYLVERLRKKRIAHASPSLGHTFYTYEFRPDQQFHLFLPSLKCDPHVCSQSYFLGSCEHERMVRDLHDAWTRLRDEYLVNLMQKLALLASRLRDLYEQLVSLCQTLAQVPYSRLVRGSYVLMTPDFLERFSLEQLLTVLRSIRFPVEDYADLDLSTIIRRACQFNHQQFRLSLN